MSKTYDAYLDVCCGAGAISMQLLNKNIPGESIYMFDGGPIGSFWQMISEKSFDMDEFEDLINKIPKDKHKIKSFLEELSTIKFDYVGEVIYEYMILQAGAFGSKQIWDVDGRFVNTSFRSYWQPTSTSSRRSPVNPMMPMPETIFENVRKIVNFAHKINAKHCLVDNINFESIKEKHKNICIYIDPPYENTEKYGLSFDVEKFVDRARKYGDVYISEYKTFGNEFHLLNETKGGGISGKSNTTRKEYLSFLKKV